VQHCRVVLTAKPSDLADHPDQRRRGPRVIWAVVAAGVVAGGITLGLALAQQGRSQTLPAAQAAQLMSIRTGCQQWLSASRAEPGPGWCTEMANWMSQNMERAGIGPQMMWGNPSTLRSSCEQWMAASPTSGAATSGRGWCDSMTSWMSANVGSWTGGTWPDWKGQGPYGPGMMGSPGRTG